MPGRPFAFSWPSCVLLLEPRSFLGVKMVVAAFQLCGLLSVFPDTTLTFLVVKARSLVSAMWGVPLLTGWAFWLGKPMGQGDKALKPL